MRFRTSGGNQYRIEIEDVVLLGSPVGMAMERRVQHKHTTRRTRKGKPVEETASEKVIAELFDATVTSWENVEDEQGAPIECTSENKRNFAEHNSAFVLDALDSFENAKADVEGKDKKK